MREKDERKGEGKGEGKSMVVGSLMQNSMLYNSIRRISKLTEAAHA